MDLRIFLRSPQPPVSTVMARQRLGLGMVSKMKIAAIESADRTNRRR
jgi:hypothetical protein